MSGGMLNCRRRHCGGGEREGHFWNWKEIKFGGGWKGKNGGLIELERIQPMFQVLSTMVSSNAEKDLELIPASIDLAKNTKYREEEGEREKHGLVPNLDTLDKETTMNKDITPSDLNDVKIDEIIKELKILKRQNQITHCLVSVLIVVTAVWQLSEVSLFLSVKEIVTHPVKSIGDFVLGSFIGKRKKRANEPLTIPPVVVPELPHVEIPCIHLNGGNGK